MKNLYALLLIVFFSGCTALNDSCGITNCHGLDIVCGSDIPQACTAIYQLGDFCRVYASCSIINNACALQTSQKFSACKTCIQDCEKLYSGPEAFDCESTCRNKMDKYCGQDSDCACGKNINTGECFYGSKELVNITEQCPDYCSGIAGNLMIKCIDAECTQIRI